MAQSLTLDQLTVVINAQTENFKREIAAINNQLEGVARKSRQSGTQMAASFEPFRVKAYELQGEFDRVGNKIGGIIKPVAAATVAGAGLVAAFVIKGGIARALNIEDARAKLTGLGHDTKIVEAIMDNALASVKGTAFGLDAAATTAANAVASGIKPGKQLEQVLKTVANSAAIAQVDMGEMGAVFNKVAASNKAQMDSINQLHDMGIPALQFIAKELGVTAEEAQKMASKGEVSFEIFERAMRQGVGNAALEMGKTTRGSWENMQAAMSRVGAAIAEDIIPKVRQAMQDVTEWFDKNSDQIVSASMKIAGAVEKAFMFLLNNGQHIIGIIAGLTAAWAAMKIGSIIAGIVVSVQAFVTKMAIFKASVLAGAGAMQALNVSMLANPATLIAVAIAALVASIVYLWTTSEGFRNFFIGMWDSIVAVVQPVVDVFRAHLLPVLQSVWSFAANQFKQAWDNLRSAFDQVRSALQPYIDQMQGPLSTVLKAIGIAIAVALVAPLVLVIATVTAVIAIIGTVINWISKLISWSVNLGMEFARMASIMNVQVVNGFVNAWSRITGVWSAATGYFRGISSGISGALSGVPGAIGGIFRSAWNTITSIFSGLPSWFSNIDLSGAGRAMINSLIGGIKSMVGNAKAAASDAVSAIRDFFPFSPAKEGPFSGKGYTTHSGKALMQDFAGAIKGQTPLLQKTMNAAMPSLNVPTHADLSGRLDMTSLSLQGLDSRPMHVTVKVGEDTLIDKVVNGINNKSFMSNSIVLNV